MRFSHVFISRPLAEGRELATQLQLLGLEALIQPAFDYLALPARERDPETCRRLDAAGSSGLLVFTSPRAVEHGLSQFPLATLSRLRVAAVGPATAAALTAAGLRPNLSPGRGYTSEALLDRLAAEPKGEAFIVAAPGGRDALLEGLRQLGWQAAALFVYRPEPAPIDADVLDRLGSAQAVLSVWTSGNAMKSLAQRLPTPAWFKLCQGEWLVISDRLKRLARAYGPLRTHLADGPGNLAIQAAVRGLI